MKVHKIEKSEIPLCVQIKNNIQNNLMQEYLKRQSEFIDYADFISKLEFKDTSIKIADAKFHSNRLNKK